MKIDIEPRGYYYAVMADDSFVAGFRNYYNAYAVSLILKLENRNAKISWLIVSKIMTLARKYDI